MSLWTILSHRTILITSVAEASQLLAFGAVEAFLPLYALSVGVDKTTVGLLFGVQIGVKTLARPLMGKVSDRHGRTRQIILGLMLTGITTALFPQTRLALILLVLSAGFGLGIAIASAATSAFVADLAPEHGRGTALGTMSTIMDVGQACGPILLGMLLMRVGYPVGVCGDWRPGHSRGGTLRPDGDRPVAPPHPNGGMTWPSAPVIRSSAFAPSTSPPSTHMNWGSRSS